MMDVPAFDAKGLLRPALRAVVLYLSVIVIALMTMIKPAQASGSVQSQPNGTYCATFFTWAVRFFMLVPRHILRHVPPYHPWPATVLPAAACV